jgi:HD-GYP domain-containing protein (c-di-GMP phosphodiesterase class II)
LYHHERWDGAGYPEGLKGEQIPIQARIVGIADAFDAMISHRVYAKPKSLSEALDELRRCAGSQFDPHLTESFIQLITNKSSFMKEGGCRHAHPKTDKWQAL